jgi:predicted phage terminase large subunit-like protein
VFIPAKLADNPHLDQEEYKKSLDNLDPITREQLLNGDWDVHPAGMLFRREWFQIVDEAPAKGMRVVRFWDLAATESGAKNDPDYTVGMMIGVKDGVYYVLDVRRARVSPLQVERLITQTAALDGTEIPIVIEEEPGSSGKSLIDHYRRDVLLGYTLRAVRPTGSKVTRAGPVASAAEAGNLKLVRGPWIADLLEELEVFPQGAHDDAVDAMSGAFGQLRYVGMSTAPSPYD